MKYLKKYLIPATALAITILGPLHAPYAGTLENMERERAIMIESLLSGDIKNSDRHRKIEIGRSRLVDLERMVMRDKSLEGKNTPAVRAAFDNYDLTFLIHASAEKGHSIADHWLGEVGLTTSALMNARMGRH